MYDNVPTAQPAAAGRQPAVRYPPLRRAGIAHPGRAPGWSAFSSAPASPRSTTRGRRSAVFGSTGIDQLGPVHWCRRTMNKLFGTRFKIIPGYRPRRKSICSMERGEVDGVDGGGRGDHREPAAMDRRAGCQVGWRASSTMCGGERGSARAVAELLQELAQDPLDPGGACGSWRFRWRGCRRQDVRSRAPDLPAARLAALRAAFAEMVRDKAFIADVAGTAQSRSAQPAAGGADFARDRRHAATVLERVRALVKVGN